ncbi:hypothetical protein ATZ36_02315 [Candidatus Endomicrobiellum trichonymphae]|uniref:30S ribosomal protein S6 n=1 Tax=Endomicrobium trichonymphae TaxID=1408204 RepID=A0A1E5IF54_ENDTX|nr:hypothetical protein ATZ36_02315 [Candidatus Endomicrobium trichonymphae]
MEKKDSLIRLTNSVKEVMFISNLARHGETVNALENFFKFNDLIVRFLTVKVEKKRVVAKMVAKAEPQAAMPQAANTAVTEVR